MRSLFGELKGAIAVWGVEGCDRCLGVEGSAIALSLCPLCLCGSLKKDVGKLERVRSLLGG